MNIEYSYGLFGYFLRYFSGIVGLMLLLLFIWLIYAIVSTNYYYQEPIDFAFLFAISIIMSLFCYKGTVYSFKYSKLFTGKYFITNENIVVTSNSSGSVKYLWSDLDKIVYKRALKIFEIEFKNGKCIILMNNAMYETKSFIDLKGFLGEKFTLQKQWF